MEQEEIARLRIMMDIEEKQDLFTAVIVNGINSKVEIFTERMNAIAFAWREMQRISDRRDLLKELECREYYILSSNVNKFAFISCCVADKVIR